MKTKPKNRFRSCSVTVFLILCGLCILLFGISAVSNLLLPSRAVNTEVLTDLEKARLAEAIHLRQTLGESVWPGFGEANIPIIIYNKQYAFLVGIKNPESGWTKVPVNEQRGGPWEVVPDDTFEGKPYYRQSLSDLNVTPEAFTVLVGNQWVASITTRDWTEIGLVEPILEDFPSWLHPILPYKLFIRVMLGDSDRYISLIQHESFHAFEGETAYAVLEAAENANHNYGEIYPWDSSELQEDWKTEIDFLVEAVRSSSEEETVELVRQFLAQREQRRSNNGLSAGMVDYERLRELEEGLAKYVQIQSLLQAAASSDYIPMVEMELDGDFNYYSTAEEFLKLEISNTKTGSEDSRLYYTGMVQAILLDRLMPNWKERVFQEGITLEELLRDSIER